jgi:hypothetical protein
LCGNTGKIDTTKGLKMPSGEEIPGGIFFCICPNGRAMKEFEERKKS